MVERTHSMHTAVGSFLASKLREGGQSVCDPLEASELGLESRAKDTKLQFLLS